MKISPLQVCLVVSNWAEDGGARFDSLRIVNNPKVRHNHKAGPRDPRLKVMEQRQWSSGGRMGRHHRGGVHMEMSATWSMHDTWKNSRAAKVRPNSLWRVLTWHTVEMSGSMKQRW